MRLVAPTVRLFWLECNAKLSSGKPRTRLWYRDSLIKELRNTRIALVVTVECRRDSKERLGGKESESE